MLPDLTNTDLHVLLSIEDSLVIRHEETRKGKCRDDIAAKLHSVRAEIARRNPNPNLPDKVERIVREWPQWSRAERSRMEDVVEDVLRHMRDGCGCTFTREFCNRVVKPKLDI